MEKKYLVKILFKNGEKLNVDTNSDVRRSEYKSMVNGFPCIVTEEQHVLFTEHIESMKVIKK
ncbi:hypothetical protein QA612_09680 [Evansella sp. AB-P1]|uniref:hypothetical protein n=1 Tax=Evansella sp. AB-P1 TaxID=3037653 RepID=UPI00241EB64D|nr:hypothetical protein [Evansella sp. AB-P1]MDG5787769.1 hypothetical protein [Evansella sp. AB-P1]